MDGYIAAQRSYDRQEPPEGVDPEHIEARAREIVNELMKDPREVGEALSEMGNKTLAELIEALQLREYQAAGGIVDTWVRAYLMVQATRRAEGEEW